MVNFTLFDHNWKKELKKKKKEREMTVKAVTSERLLLPVWQYKAIAGTSGAWLWGKVGLVWEALQRGPWLGQWPNQLWQLNRGALKGWGHAHGLHEPCDICTARIISGTWGLQVGSPDSWVGGGWPEGEDVLHMALNQQPMASDLMRAFVSLLWNAFKKRGPSVAK